MMREFEKWLARVLLLNSALTFAVVLGVLGPKLASEELPVLVVAGMLGLVSALLSLRGKVLGLWGAMLYYALQVLSYYPYAGGWSFSVKAGVSVGAVLHLRDGLFVINFIALALLAATGWICLRRRVVSA